MEDLGHLGHQMQLSAVILLGLYLLLAIVIAPRELKFLREAEPSYRLKFVLLDIALQVCILLILVPCASVAKLTLPLFITIFAGFTGLLIVVLTMGYLRHIYAFKILAESAAPYDEKTRELIRRGLELKAQRDAGASSTQGKTDA